MEKPSRNTPARPQRTCAGALSSVRESPAPSGRQRSCSKRGVRQAAESAKKETIRTIDAPQANSQAGIGRSSRATSAWASGRSWSRLIGAGLRVDPQFEDLLLAALELGLEDPFDGRREVEADRAAGLD